MSQTEDQKREDRYIRHGLALVRFGNGLALSADSQLAKLIADLRYLLSRDDISRMGKRAIAQLINDLSDVVYQRYDKVADDQSKQLAELVPVEAEFARKASGFDKAASATALAAVVSGLLLLGASIRDTWRKQAADFIFRAAAIIRAAESNDAALALLVGAKSSRKAKEAVTSTTQPPSANGEIGKARQRAQSIVHTAVSTASQDARLAAMRAGGAKYFQWHAVLDPKVCPICALRAGKLWTIDGEPIGHNIPLGTTPPAHYFCRCILLSMSGDPPADGGPDVREFDDWLSTLSESEQNDVLGKGRAQLYRDGVISLSDLLNQNGQVMTLAELKAAFN